MPLLTIAIPTRDRHDMIGDAIQSALAQTQADIELLIVDNNQNELTAAVVNGFGDPRIRYVRPPAGAGIIECWNECISCCRSPYLHIMGDDDRLDPRFIELSLRAHASAGGDLGFTFTRAAKVAPAWTFLREWGYEFPPPGRISGKRYLEITLLHECCLTLAPTVVVPMSVYQQIGGYKTGCSSNTFDFDFYLRVAFEFDVYFIDTILVDYRLHPRQLTEEHWRTSDRPTGKLGTYLDLICAISRLIRTAKPEERYALAERLQSITCHCAALLKGSFPEL